MVLSDDFIVRVQVMKYLASYLQKHGIDNHKPLYSNGACDSSFKVNQVVKNSVVKRWARCQESPFLPLRIVDLDL